MSKFVTDELLFHINQLSKMTDGELMKEHSHALSSGFGARLLSVEAVVSCRGNLGGWAEAYRHRYPDQTYFQPGVAASPKLIRPPIR
jgi:hypothetical protein